MSADRVTARRRRAFAATLLVLALAAAAWGWIERRAIARRIIFAQLPVADGVELRFTIERLDWRRFEVRDLSIGPGAPADADLTLDRLEASYSLLSLLTGQVSRVQLEGLRVMGRLEPDGLTLGSLDAWRTAGSDDTPDPTITIPEALFGLARLDARDLALTLLEPDGELRVTGEVEAQRRAVGRLTVAVDLELLDRRGRARGSWRGELAPTSASGELAVFVRASSSEDGSTASPEEPTPVVVDPELELRGRLALQDGALHFAPDGCMALRARTIRIDEVFELLAPLELCLAARREPALRVEPLDSDAMKIDLELALEPASIDGALIGGGESIRFEAELPEVRVRSADLAHPASTPIALEAVGGRLFAPLFEFEASDLRLDAEARIDPIRLDGELALARIVNRVRPDHFPRLGARARSFANVSSPWSETIDTRSK